MEYTKRLLVLEGLLSTLPDCQGWMIAKCRFSLGNRKMKTSDQFPLQILKKGREAGKDPHLFFCRRGKRSFRCDFDQPGSEDDFGELGKYGNRKRRSSL